jgi:hypothetical protein
MLSCELQLEFRERVIEGNENSLLNKKMLFWLNKHFFTGSINVNAKTVIEPLLPHRKNLPVPPLPGEREAFSLPWATKIRVDWFSQHPLAEQRGKLQQFDPSHATRTYAPLPEISGLNSERGCCGRFRIKK